MRKKHIDLDSKIIFTGYKQLWLAADNSAELGHPGNTLVDTWVVFLLAFLHQTLDVERAIFLHVAACIIHRFIVLQPGDVYRSTINFGLCGAVQAERF